MQDSERRPYRLKDYSATAWHKARLDLIGFMMNEGQHLPKWMQDVGNGLYGPKDEARLKTWKETEAQYRTHLHETRPVLARHHSPPWSTKAPAYVADIYAFLAQAGAMLEQEPELKQAA